VSRTSFGLIGCAALLLVGIAPSAQRSQDSLPDVEVLIAEGLYEEAESAARAHVSKLHASYGDDALQVASASDELVRALIVNGRGASDETLALARRSIRIKEAQLGANHADVASSLMNLGDVLAERTEFNEALAVAQRALTLRQAAARADSLDVAEAFDHLGAVMSAARRLEDALKALEESLRLKEKLLGATDIVLAGTLEEMVLVQQRRGEYEKSRILVRRAAAIRERAGVDHPMYTRTLNLIAYQFWFQGQLFESRDASERAVQLAERTLRPDHPQLASFLRNLAGTLGNLGDIQGATRLAERAFAITERNFGPNHPQTASNLYTLASLSLLEGAYATARQRFRRVLSTYETFYGPWHDYVASTLSMLANADARLGDFESARRDYSRAVTIHERVLGPNHPYVANVLTDFANVYREEGRPAQALPLFERALAIREKAEGPDHPHVARTLADMSATLVQVGQITRAQAAATRAVRIWEGLEAPNALEFAAALTLYADLQARRGNHPAAHEYYERAMAIWANTFGTSSPAYADAQAGLALTLANLGDRASALANAVNAEATGRAHLRTMLRSLPERQSLEYAAVRPRALDLILSLTGSSPEAVDVAMDSVIRSRAVVLDEMAARQRSQPGSRTDSLRTAFTSAQQRLANLVVRGPGQLSPSQYSAVVEEARRDSEQAEQSLAERSADFRSERSRAQLGLDEVRAALPDDGALVSFVRHNRTVFSDSTKSPVANQRSQSASRVVPSYVALVTRKGQPSVAISIGAAHTIDSLVSRWRADIAAEAVAPAQTAAAPSASSSRVSGLELRRLVWDRVTPLLGNTTRVFIVPDGTLNLVPFGALPAGQRSYLIERSPLVHYLSAERDVVPSSDSAGSVGHGLLAVGGPAFDDATPFAAGQSKRNTAASNTTTALREAVRSASSPCDVSRGVQAITFTPLKGTLQEVRELSRVWTTSATASDEPSRLLVGHEASEQNLKKDASGYRVLHLATHGFFLRDACPPGRAGTRAVGGLVSAGQPSSNASPVENALLLSGLALAGANRREHASPNEDDGILTAAEVASLNLRGVEWAVLSACDTGLGEIRSGEGVLGLRRAFHIAGARTVIMSLWPVDDQATRVWMRELYEGRLKRHLDTADAMRDAGLAVLRSRRAAGQSTAPFYWAAFVAAGDWR
jgi:CHAT domain-containing protein/tetratricopeptide (TPR) repeat protein